MLSLVNIQVSKLINTLKSKLLKSMEENLYSVSMHNLMLFLIYYGVKFSLFILVFVKICHLNGGISWSDV